MSVENIQLIPGFLQITTDGGRVHRIAVRDVLRAGDIPDLTIDSLTLLNKLAQVVLVLVKTLEEQNILTNEIADGFDMEYIREVLLDDLEAEEDT